MEAFCGVVDWSLAERSPAQIFEEELASALVYPLIPYFSMPRLGAEDVAKICTHVRAAMLLAARAKEKESAPAMENLAKNTLLICVALLRGVEPFP